MDERHSRRPRADLNILDTLNDPKIFGPLFKDSETWTAWRSFLCALFGLAMTEQELTTFRTCTARPDPPTMQAREAWLVVGRKGGKSRMLALIATYLAAFIDWRPYLSVGERGLMRFSGFWSGKFDTTTISTAHRANMTPMNMRRSRIISMSITSGLDGIANMRWSRVKWDNHFADWPKRQSSEL
jgi:hypothetical protein